MTKTDRTEGQWISVALAVISCIFAAALLIALWFPRHSTEPERVSAASIPTVSPLQGDPFDCIHYLTRGTRHLMFFVQGSGGDWVQVAPQDEEDVVRDLCSGQLSYDIRIKGADIPHLVPVSEGSSP